MEKFSVARSLSLGELAFWFQNQDPAGRLDAMTTLLQMLHPLELRFIGAVVEDLARKDHDYFRDCEMRYNAETFVNESLDLSNAACRSKLLVALSLLHSTNYAIANVLYGKLMTLDTLCDKLPKTKDILDEILLLLNMGKHHPAFGFDQRLVIAQLADKMSRLWKSYLGCNGYTHPHRNPSATTPSECSVVFANNVRPDCNGIEDSRVHASTQTVIPDITAKQSVENHSQTEANSFIKPEMIEQSMQTVAIKQVRINNAQDCSVVSESLDPNDEKRINAVQRIEAMGMQLVDNGLVIYEIKVHYANGDNSVVRKSYDDFYYFHKDLLDLRANEAGLYSSSRSLPYLPCYHDSTDVEREENVFREIRDYVRDLNASRSILESELLYDFVNNSTPSMPLTQDVTSSRIVGPSDLSRTRSLDRTSSPVDALNMGKDDNVQIGKCTSGRSFSDTCAVGRTTYCGGLMKDTGLCMSDQLPSPSSSNFESHSHRKLPPISKNIDPSMFISRSKSIQEVGQASLSTALIIVGPNSASTNRIGKLIESRMFSSENSTLLRQSTTTDTKESTKLTSSAYSTMSL